MLAKAIFTFLLITLFIPLLIAQQDSLNPVCKLLKLNSNWDFGAGVRFNFLDFDEMNRSLEAAGLPGLNSPVTSLNLGVRTTCSWKRYIMETGFKYGFGSSNKENLANRQSVTFRDYGVQSRLMYDAFPRSLMSKIFPFAGLGASYQVLETHSGSSDFGNSSLLASAYRNRRFTYVPFSFETGLSLEQGINMRSSKLIVGLRCGYAFRFFQTRWALENNVEVDLPKPAASSPFVALVLRVKSKPKATCCMHTIADPN